MKSIFNARIWSLAYVYIIEQPPTYFTDYQYSAGFHGLGGLFSPWLDATYFAPSWHLPHPALVKGKYRDVTAFRKERKKWTERGKYFTLFYVSWTWKKSLKREPTLMRESALSISLSSRRLPMIHTRSVSWTEGWVWTLFSHSGPLSTVPSSCFPVATYIPLVVETTMRLTTTSTPANGRSKLTESFFLRSSTVTPRFIQFGLLTNFDVSIWIRQ